MQKGFTLLELLVVIAIIGILSSIILVSYNGYTDKARTARTLQWAKSVEHSIGDQAAGVWTFDNITGTTVYDDSGNNNNGTAYGGPAVVDGVVGKAMQFDGVDDYVNLGNPSNFPVTGAVTLEFWAYPKNYALRRQNPICKAYGGEFCMTMEPGSSINLYYGTAGGNNSPYTWITWPNGTLVNNEWIHLVWTKDPINNKVVAYKNGKAVQTTTCGIYCNTTISSLNFFVGNGYAGIYFGLIDDIRIFNTAFTQAQIQQHYADGLKIHQNLAKNTEP